MKICLVSSSYLPYTSGVSIHVHNLAHTLRALGHTVQILTTSYPKMNQKPENSVTRIGRVIFLPAKGSYFTLPIGLRLPLAVRDFLQHFQPDIVHLHGFAPPEIAFWALHYSKARNVATIHTTNIPKSRFGTKIYRHLFAKYNNKLHGRIAVSNSAKQAIEPYLPGYYQVIPNGIFTHRFNPTVKRLEEFNDSRPKILYVGRLEKRKGLSILLKALPVIKQKIPDTILIVVGNGPAKNYFQRMVTGLKIVDSVEFIGFVPNEELPSYYASSDVYCSPTLYPEANSIVILEAMATGKPVVAPDFPGYREIIGDNENGVLFKPKNSDDLAAKLIRLLSENNLREKLIVNGLQKAQEFDWYKIAKKIENFYQALKQNIGLKTLVYVNNHKQSVKQPTARNIYLLYASRKGGHRFPAEALLEYMKINYSYKMNCQLFNLLDYAKIASILDTIGRLGDLFLPKIWRRGYQHLESNRKLFSRVSRFILSLIFSSTLNKILQSALSKIDLIISFQPEVNVIFPYLKKNLCQRFETIIVDYSAHSLWVQNCIQYYYVGSDFVADKLKNLGVDREKIKVSGIPQKISFFKTQKITISEQRKVLNLNPDLPTITVMGGFLGKMIDYELVIKSIIQANFNCQLIVIFGKNKKAYKRCQKLIEQSPILIRPYVALPDVAEVMWAADIIITKPGAVTIGEAFALGKPLILITPKAGSAQELTFAQNVQASGAGIYISQTKTVGSLVKQLFQNREKLLAMTKKSEALGELNRTATQFIAENILNHLGLT